MTFSIRARGLRAVLLASCVLMSGGTAIAADASADVSAPADQLDAVVVSIARTTRSAVSIDQMEVQKLLPGINPLKAIQTLPGVLFVTADPWGNNEQNESLVVHGFNTQQLGYTMDGVPLGDQQYGNYNGLSMSRALSSENTDKVVLSSGAGSLGVASTSNLGGAIETFSRNPSKDMTFEVRETLGSYKANRTFLRADSGEGLLGGAAYVSWLHQDAKAWDFAGHQKGDQVNFKYVRDAGKGRLTLYADWQDKTEPNEDATASGNNQSPGSTTYPYTTSTYFPYTRPFLYPNYNAGLAYLTAGAPPAAVGNNFQNYTGSTDGAIAINIISGSGNLIGPNLYNSVTTQYADGGTGTIFGLSLVPAPSTAGSAGFVGDVAKDATHWYVCIATNTWVRTTLATF